MRKLFLGCISSLLYVGLCAGMASAQGATGAIEINARITATGARPEPVREFQFYVLTKSYAEIMNEVDTQDVVVTREQFISKMKVTPELSDWLKAHDIMDLTSPEVDKMITVDDIVGVPEFFAAYQRSNSGGVTVGLPVPKFKEAEKAANPARYEKLKAEYIAATRKFILVHPGTVGGIELELGAVSPKYQWDKLHADHRNKVAQLAPDVAQSKYLAAKLDTDLDGHAVASGLPAGEYWISTLGMATASGDRRLAWDVEAKVAAGQTTSVTLSNINGADPNVARP